ncbi:MAG TPA: adenine phosphoribosyltransferase [Dehalococcoidia bacterium]|nr:adenine phosphoribosyltransferase [Dehalococcoidia bacterium]
MTRSVRELDALIRDIPDFPQPGILFKDITPLLAAPGALADAIDLMVEAVKPHAFDVIVATESRGFLFAAPLADRLKVGLVPVRKVGKLPHQTLRIDYTLEYGTNTLEIHRDAITPSQKVLIVDDLLATGGTVGGCLRLIEQLGGEVTAFAFLIELTFLKGRALLGDRPIVSLIQY